MECDRCGKCCYEFTTQIHFLPGEEFLKSSVDFADESINFLVEKFHITNENFRRVSKGKIRHFIPTKDQILPYIDQTKQQTLKAGMKYPHECLFLRWKNDLPVCIIHKYNPQMCKDYPIVSKGGVCRNHPERKYTRAFLNYQKSKIGFAIGAVQKIYGERISNNLAYEILTLLMDFGDFDKEKLMQFFEKEFHSEREEIEEVIHELLALGLLFCEKDRIQGISLKEVEKMIDQIMKEHGWKYPAE